MKLVQSAILSFTHKTPPTLFSLYFGETSFRWAQVENAWAHQKFSSPSLLTKQHPFSFSPLFSLQIFPSSLKSTHPILVLETADCSTLFFKKKLVLQLLLQNFFA